MAALKKVVKHEIAREDALATTDIILGAVKTAAKAGLVIAPGAWTFLQFHWQWFHVEDLNKVATINVKKKPAQQPGDADDQCKDAWDALQGASGWEYPILKEAYDKCRAEHPLRPATEGGVFRPKPSREDIIKEFEIVPLPWADAVATPSFDDTARDSLRNEFFLLLQPWLVLLALKYKTSITDWKSMLTAAALGEISMFTAIAALVGGPFMQLGVLKVSIGPGFMHLEPFEYKVSWDTDITSSFGQPGDAVGRTGHVNDDRMSITFKPLRLALADRIFMSLIPSILTTMLISPAPDATNVSQ